MPDQVISVQEAVTRALLGSTVYSALLSVPCVQPKAYYVPSPSPGKKIESILALAARENPFFDQNVAISILKSEADRAKSEAAKGGVGETVAERFHRLASEWSKEIQNVSSLTIMTEHLKYRQIVSLGWDVVPFLVVDLQRNRRYWLPALQEITGIQPFDRSDMGNGKRMMEAWTRWGKNKHYIK
jgi:hypothetical protein